MEEHGDPALDAGCGTGRILLPLRAAGLDVDGCDLSADMLALCRDRAAAEGLKPGLYHQALHALALPRIYRTIFSCGAFGLGGGGEQGAPALRCLYAHLAPPVASGRRTGGPAGRRPCARAAPASGTRPRPARRPPKRAGWAACAAGARGRSGAPTPWRGSARARICSGSWSWRWRTRWSWRTPSRAPQDRRGRRGRQGGGRPSDQRYAAAGCGPTKGRWRKESCRFVLTQTAWPSQISRSVLRPPGNARCQGGPGQRQHDGRETNADRDPGPRRPAWCSPPFATAARPPRGGRPRARRYPAGPADRRRCRRSGQLCVSISGLTDRPLPYQNICSDMHDAGYGTGTLIIHFAFCSPADPLLIPC